MKKQYAELKDKLNLPNYEEMNKDFEICSIDEEDDILREITKKMTSTVDYYINFLEDIIQPDSRFYTLKEANVLSVDARKIVNNTYNKLMFFNRAYIELFLNYSEQNASEYINQLFQEWQIIKKDLMPIIKTLKESWSKITETKPEGGYFG